MKLDETTSQKLKDERIQIEDLSDWHFVDKLSRNSYYQIGNENILKLLNNNICSFQQIVDKFKSIRYDRVSCLCKLLDKHQLFLFEKDRKEEPNQHLNIHKKQTTPKLGESYEQTYKRFFTRFNHN